MKLILRENYLNRLINVIGTPDIKITTGIRRSGKSKLLESFKNYIQQAIHDSNIIHINFNLPEYEKLMNYHDLYEYVKNKYKPNVHNFVLIDEVQMSEGFEKAINGLHALEKFDLYITGSNAFLLSSDLATLFTGRTFEIKIFPFSFTEYCEYFQYTDQYIAFDKYIFEGGMSGSYLYKNIEDKYDYLNNVFLTLVVKDIKQKYKIRNAELMDRIINYLMNNISNLSSYRKISSELSKNNSLINHKTVGMYITYLCNAFSFYEIKRYDIQGKKYLSSNSKYYLVDTSFRYAKLGTKDLDFGRCIENIVAIELLRRGYEVYVGTLYKKEIDFVAIKRNEKLYIQVSDNISDESTFKREVDSLLRIKDAYPKILLTRTKYIEYQYEGIRIIDIADWLLRK